MPYTLDQGKTTLKNTIKNKLRHRDYKRVTELANVYKIFVTGENADTLLKQFNPRENDELFKQKKLICQAITSYMANMIMSPMFKVGRTRADQSITWTSQDKTEEKKKELITVSGSYHGEDESVDSYLTIRMVELDSTDANSFIVTEFDGSFDPTKAVSKTNKKVEPYPFEVNSHEAVNYKYVNNKLQFLIVLNEFAGPIKDSKESVFEKYTIYLENESIVATQIHKDDLPAFIAETKPGTYEIYYVDEENKDKSDIFILRTLLHKAGRIPAKRVGTKRDFETRGRTCVPMMHAAYPFFMKSIKTVSEFDLANCLHLFPQKIQYDEVCVGDIINQKICSNGKDAAGSVCSVCSGTGWKTHLSSADIIRVRLPKDMKDLVPLDNYMVYKGPNIELLTFMKELGLYELPQLAIKAVYISELYTSDKVTTTATEKNIDLDSVYDTLKSFADNWSSMWKHIMNIIANYRDIQKDITIQHQFPKDFKMKSVTMLLQDLNTANTSGAPSYIKSEINKDIAEKIYIDKPTELLKITVKNKFFPFNGKSESEINSIIMNDLTTRYNKVLYANFDNIFDEIDAEVSTGDVDFYKMEKSKQIGLIKTKVDALITTLDLEGAADRASSFNSFPAEA